MHVIKRKLQDLESDPYWAHNNKIQSKWSTHENFCPWGNSKMWQNGERDGIKRIDVLLCVYVHIHRYVEIEETTHRNSTLRWQDNPKPKLIQRIHSGNPEYRDKDNYMKLSLQGICRNISVHFGLPYDHKWKSVWSQFFLDLKGKGKPNDVSTLYQFVLFVACSVIIMFSGLLSKSLLACNIYL